MSAIARLYNAFDPYKPLPAGDPAYVNCEEVRGDRNGETWSDGLDRLKKVIKKRAEAAQINSGRIFDTPETLEKLCLMSGGHIRNLMLYF